MAMHSAYRTHNLHAHSLHALGACLNATWLLLPGAAWALGAVTNADGAPISSDAFEMIGVGAVVLNFTVALAITLAIASVLNCGGQAWWNSIFKTKPPFGFVSVAALAVALLLGAFGVLVIPAFAALFTSLGSHFPVPTLLLLKFGHLLPILALLLIILLVVLRSHPRRERYFAAILATELFFLVFAIGAMYFPIFRAGETVAG